MVKYLPQKVIRKWALVDKNVNKISLNDATLEKTLELAFLKTLRQHHGSGESGLVC